MATVRSKEKLGKALFAAAAVICVIAVCAIFAFLIFESIPAFRKIGILDFLFGELWMPDRLDRYSEPLSGRYGIFTMIVGTLAATAGALSIGGFFGYFTAVFLVFYCPQRLRRPLTSAVNLLAGIPSVVYGFFGIVFLLPILALIAPNNGSGLLATSLILGVMILPTVVSLSKTSLEAVPKAYYEGSAALGVSHSETVFRVMSPAAKSGIVVSLVLGVGRALGETMAVVMVAGNAPTYPGGLFGSFRVLTANIVMEMGYAGEVQEGALVATGVVLLIFVLIVNIMFGAISRKAVAGAVKKAKRGYKKTSNPAHNFKYRISAIKYRIRSVSICHVLSIASGIITSIFLGIIVVFIFAKGLPQLFRDPSMIWRKYEFASHNITIFPSIVSTLYVLIISLVIAIPIGIMTAVFLNEYAKKENAAVRIIRFAVDILSGVPSIVYGLFGMVAFLPLIGGSASVLAGGLTISIMLLPIIVRSTEESLRSVPDSMREGSFALGAGKLRTILNIVLPSALPGIISAAILCGGRVISESAPFLYTMGSVIGNIPKSLFDSGATLAVSLYQLSGEGWYMNEAYATAVVLIVMVFLLNLAAESFGSRLSKRLKGESDGK